MSADLLALAESSVALARKNGADEASARVQRTREVEVRWRDGRLEQISEATTRGLSLRLYVGGRYAVVSSSDLRAEALETFVSEAVALTAALAPDPYRALPDPALYDGRAEIDLELEDPSHDALSPDERRRVAREMEEAARSVAGAEAILSVTTAFADRRSELAMLSSNGLVGTRRETSYFMSADVSVEDEDGRRPEDGTYAGARVFRELPDVAEQGRLAAERAILRRGARKGGSAVLPMAVENRAAGRLVSHFFAALTGAALQQKRSFFDGRLGSSIGSPLLHVSDDPLVPKGLGSRLFDSEGLAARPLPIFEEGVLRSFYVDTYYAKKLAAAPTTGDISNLSWRLGTKSLPELLRDMGEGILVTGFLGGNSNTTTGDFSVGVQGVRVRGGAPAEPIAEMNVSGNHLELWKNLAAVGNDPYPASPLRTPTLVFEGVQFAGS